AGAHSQHNTQKTESEILFMVPLSSFLIYRENSIYRPFIKGSSPNQNELQEVEPSCGATLKTLCVIGYGACGALLRTISLSLEGTDRRNLPSDDQRENDDNGSHRGHGGRCADEVRHHTGKQSASRHESAVQHVEAHHAAAQLVRDNKHKHRVRACEKQHLETTYQNQNHQRQRKGSNLRKEHEKSTEYDNAADQ